MSQIIASLPDARDPSLERVWRLALQQELGLVVEVTEDSTMTVTSVQTRMYEVRKQMLELDPTLPLLDFYVTLPKDMNLLVIVREPKAQLE